MDSTGQLSLRPIHSFFFSYKQLRWTKRENTLGSAYHIGHPKWFKRSRVLHETSYLYDFMPHLMVGYLWFGISAKKRCFRGLGFGVARLQIWAAGVACGACVVWACERCVLVCSLRVHGVCAVCTAYLVCCVCGVCVLDVCVGVCLFMIPIFSEQKQALFITSARDDHFPRIFTTVVMACLSSSVIPQKSAKGTFGQKTFAPQVCFGWAPCWLLFGLLFALFWAAHFALKLMRRSHICPWTDSRRAASHKSFTPCYQSCNCRFNRYVIAVSSRFRRS